MPSEAQARITINKLLEEAGWRLDDSSGRPANVVCEQRTTGKKFNPKDDLGVDYENVKDGFVDYLLKNDDGRAVAVVEAKREGIEPLTAKEQARDYAKNLNVSHIFLSNGLILYYWNLHQGNPTKVTRFLPLDDLGRSLEWKPDSKRLKSISVDENYIAVSQDSNWLKYAPEEKPRVMKNKKIRLLRDYQLEAVRALQNSATPDQHRFLFEMATGTGKTLLSAAVAKLYLRTENAHRILFLVDRLELENQARKNFRHYLANDGIQTVVFKQRRNDWKQAQVVITTIQSLATKNRYLHEFAPHDFQLIISDEAHRTISGNNRSIFEYFVGAKLGLTATPRDYLKGINNAQPLDPREMERRLLLDTYQTFGCPNGNPTFRFSLTDAVRHKPPYLVNPCAFDARTEITTQMLSEEGYAVTKITEDGEEVEIVFGKKSYERKFFSDETNQSFVQCFLDNAKVDPITGEIGKTIMFAVSRKHATKLTEILNEQAAKRWPNDYGSGSSFAVQVTSDIADSQGMTIQFSENNLNGKSRWRNREYQDYNTCRSRVCVTVGMMTTGYDCEDLLNVVLARPIFSPPDFIQIKGRGTRLFEFAYGERKADKDSFALFDFFANCQYFEKDFKYDQKLALPKPRQKGNDDENGEQDYYQPEVENFHVSTSPDPITSVKPEAVGPDGMRIDREMYRTGFAERTMKFLESNPQLKTAVEMQNLPLLEEMVRKHLFDKPEEYWNLQKLQDYYQTDRKPSLREILSYILSLIPKIPNTDDLAQEAFEKFQATQNFLASHAREIRTVFLGFLLNSDLRNLILSGDFARLSATDSVVFHSLQRLEADERQTLLGYLKEIGPIGL